MKCNAIGEERERQRATERRKEGESKKENVGQREKERKAEIYVFSTIFCK